MVALLMLRPEDRDIVLHGGIYDPSYRPSDLDESDNEGEIEVLGERRRRRVAPDALPMMLASAWWRRYDVHVAVLLAHVEPVTTSRGGPPDDLAVIGLARAEGGPRRRGSGTREVTIGPWIVLPAPVPLRRLTDPLPSRHRTKIWEIAYGMARPLPPGADQALRTTLANEIANFDDIAARLADRQAPSQRARSETRTALRYDTVTTALRLFDPSWRQLAPVETPTEAPPEVDGLLAELSERDVIVDDTVVFPGWNRSRRSVAGWWEFRSRGRRLLIKSIDATHYEARTGADLVYLRREPDAFVLVQYKMLRQSRDGRWVYRIDRRLPGQLRRMIDCCQAATNGDHEPTSASTVDSFRIGPSSAFVKFVQPTRRLRADELTTGYYLPAEFVQLLLEGAAQNHPRTTVLRVPEGRYLDPRTFVRLVQDSWVGTLREPTQALRALLLRSTQRWRTTDVTFAYDEPMLDEDDNDR